MSLQSFSTSTETANRNSLITRVLHLRHQLGINVPLSLRDSEDMLLSPREQQKPSMETSRQALPAYDRRDWLGWNQSPGEGNRPDKGQKDLL